VLLAGLAACAAPQTARLIDSPGDLPRRVELTEVPFFSQVAYYCGPAALAMTLKWSGLDTSPESIAPQVYTPGREGTLAPDIVAASRRAGRLAVQIHELDDLLAEIADGNPVLVFQNLSLDLVPRWHFAVAVGYDLDQRTIILRSGITERLVTPLDAFERTWARTEYWALVTLPPERLPATGDQLAVLAGAAGLEQAGRFDAASVAYGGIIGRWPESPVAWIGQGNAHFALGDFVEAERSFARATQLQPDSAAAWNNLANALSRQGRRGEAIAAAARALALVEGDDANYRDTLEEVLR